ncbi:MAG: hypothetical protein ACREBQ_02010 [Nitrososphaerales archaeon]
MGKRKKTPKKRELGLDGSIAKRGRGRPRRMPAGEIHGRADNYRGLFWERKFDKKTKQLVPDHPYAWAEQIIAATNEDELRKAIDAGPSYVQAQFAPSIALILSVLRERTFPKTTPARLNYLADSIAGSGLVSPRSSRDICGRERAKQRLKSPHRITRKEFYIECTCGYKGPALNNACRKCKAEIPLSAEDLGLA